METNEQVSVNEIEFHCAIGIILNLMRTGMLTTEEYDAVVAKLKHKYGIENGCAE